MEAAKNFGYWQSIWLEAREFAWLLCVTAVLSIAGTGLGVALALVADSQSLLR